MRLIHDVIKVLGYWKRLRQDGSGRNCSDLLVLLLEMRNHLIARTIKRQFALTEYQEFVDLGQYLLTMGDQDDGDLFLLQTLQGIAQGQFTV